MILVIVTVLVLLQPSTPSLALSNTLETRPNPRKEILKAIKYPGDYVTFSYVRLT